MNAPLRQLTWVFTRDVTFTFGGGNASMELLRRSLQARGWIDAPTHALLMAVSRLTPGTSILAFCASGGWLLNGWRGTLAAVAGGSLPGSLIIFGLAATLGTLDRYTVVRGLLSFGMLAAAWLVLVSAWALLKPYLTGAGRRRVLIIIAIAASLYLIGWTPVRVLVVSAIAGVLLPTAKRGRVDQPTAPTATMSV
jgi:chromate transporter